MNKTIFIILITLSTMLYSNQIVNFHNFDNMLFFEDNSRFSKKIDDLFEPLTPKSNDSLEPKIAETIVILSIVSIFLISSGTYFIVKANY